MNVICSSNNIRVDQTAKLAEILHSIVEQIPNVQVNIFELLYDCNKEEAPSKKALAIANAINDALGGNKTIVSGKTADTDFDEIGISSICGSAYDTFVINFIGEKESAQLFLFDSAPTVTLNF